MAEESAVDREVDDTSEYDRASRELLRRLADTSQQMAAAEPGTEDFLTAYVESVRLREMYNQVRGTWRAPAEIWDELPDGPGGDGDGSVDSGDTHGHDAAL